MYTMQTWVPPGPELGQFYTDLTVSFIINDKLHQSDPFSSSDEGAYLLRYAYDPLLTSLNNRITKSQMKKMGYSKEVCHQMKLSGQCKIHHSLRSG